MDGVAFIANAAAKATAKRIILTPNKTANAIFKAALGYCADFAANLPIGNIAIIPFGLAAATISANGRCA
jgi:hypothetical protein